MVRQTRPMAALLVGAAIFICIAGIGSPAFAIFSDDEARRAILDLRTRLEVSNSRVDALNARIDDLQKQLQNSAQGQLQLLNENERLRADLARLRGQLEETGRLATTGKTQQKDLYIDLDQRLKQIEPVTVESNGIAYRVSGPEKTQFEELQESLRSGNFKKTSALADRFMVRFPASQLGPRVLLMKGTALYADRNYKAAIAARESFIKRYPEHPEVPQAALNLAASQAESGATAPARKTLEDILQNFPDTAAAAEARERLSMLPAPTPEPEPEKETSAAPAAKKSADGKTVAASKASDKSAPAKSPAPKAPPPKASPNKAPPQK